MTILTDTKAKTISPHGGKIADGTQQGLWLCPSNIKGRGYWQLRYTSPVTGKRRDIGLGTYPDVSISFARKQATETKEAIAAGLCPLEERRASQDAAKAPLTTMLTFEAAAREYIGQKRDGWSNAKHAKQWLSTLESHVFPLIGNRKVDELAVEDFQNVLAPIWLTKAETAGRVKQRCSKIIKWCWAKKLVQQNVLDVVEELLPDPKAARESAPMPAMPWENVPEFVRGTLRNSSEATCRPLMEMLILCATRSGETREMTWDQIDFEEAIWTIPKEKAKTRRVHQVPLSARCLEILQSQIDRFKEFNGKDPVATDLVFPSPTGKSFSDMTLSKFMKDKKCQSDTEGKFAVPHGFRTAFRGWATVREYPEHLIEMCLAHMVKSKTVRAYNRETLLPKRREIMEAYSAFISEDSRNHK